MVEDRDFLIIAHRGDNRYYTENTIPAFDSSLKKGALALELDLITLRDGSVVLFHDSDLKRLCNKDIAVKDLTHFAFKEVFPDLVKLEEFAERYSSMDVLINFEIKDDPSTLESAKDLLATFHKPLISSFFPGAVERAFRYGFDVAYLFATKTDLFNHLAAPAVTDRIHLNADLVAGADQNLDDALSAKRVYCYTVNDPRELQVLRKKPYVAGVFSDDPQCLRMQHGEPKESTP